MSEDDTFNSLRRTPIKEMWLKRLRLDRFNNMDELYSDLLKSNGWTKSEYAREYEKWVKGFYLMVCINYLMISLRTNFSENMGGPLMIM
jgi:hypothetical protein